MKLQDAKAAENNPKMIYGSFDPQAVLTLPFLGIVKYIIRGNYHYLILQYLIL